jgi:hypothetical protein
VFEHLVSRSEVAVDDLGDVDATDVIRRRLHFSHNLNVIERTRASLPQLEEAEADSVGEPFQWRCRQQRLQQRTQRREHHGHLPATQSESPLALREQRIQHRQCRLWWRVHYIHRHIRRTLLAFAACPRK